MNLFLAAIAFVIGVWFVWWLFVLVPYRMALHRHRDGIAWVLVSLIGSPFLAILLLWLLGPKASDPDRP